MIDVKFFLRKITDEIEHQLGDLLREDITRLNVFIETMDDQRWQRGIAFWQKEDEATQPVVCTNCDDDVFDEIIAIIEALLL